MPGSPVDSDRVTRLADELAELSRRLDRARVELLSWYPAAPPAVHPPAEPVRRAETERKGDGLFSGRVLAWTGGAITLVGVVMFLTLAASRGWLGVPARLIVGGLLGLALVGLGCWLHRRPEGRTGALALVGTGVAALYLDVGTATAKYHHLPDAVGLVLGLAVAGTGLALAERWRSRLLAGGAIVGVGMLMPALTGGSLPMLVALVLVPQLAAAPVARRRRWTELAVLGAVFPVLYASIAVFATLWSSTGQRPATTAAVVAVFVVGAVLALLGSGRLPSQPMAALLVAAPLPALELAGAHGGRPGWLLAGLVAVALLGVAVLRRPPRVVRVAAAAAGGVAIFEATTVAFGGAVLTGVLLGQALVLTVLAVAAERRGPLLGAACYGVVGVGMAVFRDAPVRALTIFPAEPYLRLGLPYQPALLTGLTLSALVLLLAAAALVAATRLGLAGADSASAWLWAPTGAIGLYGAAGVVLTSVLLVVPEQGGFVAAHAVVTISWTLAALVLLAMGIARPALRVAGMVLVAASVAKLVLFDLIALDGLARVAAFVGAGLLLLAAGSRYARLVARAARR